jgi:hypothetical protein
MARFSEDNELGPAPSKTPRDPGSVLSSDRAWLVYVAMLVLGLPVLFVIVAPLAVGGWILWHQTAIYRAERQWPQFSLFELATRTAKPELAMRLSWPELSVCEQFGGEHNSNDTAGALPNESEPACPGLSPFQNWLLDPDSPSRSNAIVAGTLRLVPVSSVFFLLGLLSSYVLRLVGKR